MKERVKRAFIMDGDEFVRLSLNRILKKYGFVVEEIEDFSQLEGRRRDIEAGMILADMDIQTIEKWSPFLKRWNERFILMTPLSTDELTPRLEKAGISHILKKPVEPERLRRVIQKISFPNGDRDRSSGKSRSEKKGRAAKGGFNLRAA
jgi:DNA-binding NtrC family response regulator